MSGSIVVKRMQGRYIDSATTYRLSRDIEIVVQMPDTSEQRMVPAKHIRAIALISFEFARVSWGPVNALSEDASGVQTGKAAGGMQFSPASSGKRSG